MKDEILPLKTMGADGCWWSGAIQDNLVGSQLMTILTGQGHISKVWVTILYQIPQWTFDFCLKIISTETSQGGANYSFFFSFYFQNKRKEFQHSISFLKLYKCDQTFSLSSRKLRIFCLISFSLLKMWKENWNFSFSSRNWGNWFQISLSHLKTCDREIRLHFLLARWEKLFSNFYYRSRIDFFASRWPLGQVLSDTHLRYLETNKTTRNEIELTGWITTREHLCFR